MTEATPALATYRALLQKVDAKFAEIRSRHPAAFRCGAGCHGCCLPGLTVSALEAEALRTHLEARPELAAELRALAAADPHQGQRCSFLQADGRCGIYEARPVVCRSHGAPLVVSGGRDVCPLNFDGVPLDQVPATDVLNVDTLNTLLALLNSQHAAAAGVAAAPDSRTPLRIDALLGGTP